MKLIVAGVELALDEEKGSKEQFVNVTFVAGLSLSDFSKLLEKTKEWGVEVGYTR